MNVKELIEHLQKFPQNSDVVCIYLCCSDYSILEPEQVTYHPANFGAPDGYSGRMDKPVRYVKRNGQIMQYDPMTWDPNEVPHFVDIVAFPGN